MYPINDIYLLLVILQASTSLIFFFLSHWFRLGVVFPVNKAGQLLDKRLDLHDESRNGTAITARDCMSSRSNCTPCVNYSIAWLLFYLIRVCGHWGQVPGNFAKGSCVRQSTDPGFCMWLAINCSFRNVIVVTLCYSVNLADSKCYTLHAMLSGMLKQFRL